MLSRNNLTVSLCIAVACIAVACLVGAAEAAFGRRAREAVANVAEDVGAKCGDAQFQQKVMWALVAAVAGASLAGFVTSQKKTEESKSVEAVPRSAPSKTFENSTSEQKVLASFPFAMTNAELVRTVQAALKPYGYGKSSLLATSLCCDEVNRILDDDFAEIYGDNFSMGGLAGFAFGGVTSFGAMAHHIPEGGSCLIVYGPHVGVDTDGNVGKINRRGRQKSGACCGSAAAACGFCTAPGAKAPLPSADPIDQQQAYVSAQLLPYADRLKQATDLQVELPKALFDAQKKLMDRIVAAGCGEVHSPGNIAVLGGIQINTPAGVSEFFLPLSFELRDNKANLIRKFI